MQTSRHTGGQFTETLNTLTCIETDIHDYNEAFKIFNNLELLHNSSTSNVVIHFLILALSSFPKIIHRVSVLTN